MESRADVVLCFTFASFTILALGGVILALASGKILPGNAIQETVRQTIKEVFGNPN